MSDAPKITWRDVYDDRGLSLHVSQAAVTAAAQGYRYLRFRDVIYRVNRDGTWAESGLTVADVE